LNGTKYELADVFPIYQQAFQTSIAPRGVGSPVVRAPTYFHPEAKPDAPGEAGLLKDPAGAVKFGA
jgi:hypothetical protein